MKRIALLLFPLLWLPATAQVPVAPVNMPHVTFVNASGGACAGCSLQTFIAGTTTPQPTYTDASGTSVNTNPIVLDAAGGANIWVGRLSYKFILKDTLGNTIWTVDNVNEGNLFPCGPAGSVQISNTAVTGLTCDANIFIDPINHTLNVGILPRNYVTIGALSTPTSWTFDTTSPATALASLGGGTISPGTTNQIAIYPAAGNNLQGVSAIPNGITATTQAPSDNTSKVATTGYVATPGTINPTSVQVATGVAMTDNQGNGTKVQHSTGTTTTNDCTKFDTTGNVVDAGAPCLAGTSTLTDYYWTTTSCAVGISQPNSCTSTTYLPGNMPDSSYQVFCSTNDITTPVTGRTVCSLYNGGSLPTSSSIAITYQTIQIIQGGSGGAQPTLYFHAHHN